MVEHEKPLGSPDHIRVSGRIPETTLVRNDGRTIELNDLQVERFMVDGLQAAFPKVGWQDFAGGPCVPSYQLIEDLEATPERQEAFDAAVQRMTDILQGSTEKKPRLSSREVVNLLILHAPEKTFSNGVECHIQTEGETVKITFDNFFQNKDPHHQKGAYSGLGKGMNQNAAKKQDSKDAKTLSAVLKEMLPDLGISDVNAIRRTVTLSSNAIDALQIKQQDNTLESDFKAALEKTQDQTQGRGA